MAKKHKSRINPEAFSLEAFRHFGITTLSRAQIQEVADKNGWLVPSSIWQGNAGKDQFEIGPFSRPFMHNLQYEMFDKEVLKEPDVSLGWIYRYKDGYLGRWCHETPIINNATVIPDARMHNGYPKQNKVKVAFRVVNGVYELVSS